MQHGGLYRMCIAGVSLLIFFIITGAIPYPVFAVACTGLPAINIASLSGTCTISTLTGVDDAGNNEASTINNGTLTLDNMHITINTGATLSASFKMVNGSSVYFQSGGQVKPKIPMYVADGDADGWAKNFTTIYDASGSGRRRLGLMRGVSSTDCRDSQYLVSNKCSLGTGNDGTVTVSVSKNINTDKINATSYADGIAYRVVAPADGATSVTRYAAGDTISNGIAVGDEVLIINLQGTSTDYADVGNYEFMIVSAVSASTITFSEAITKSYNGTTAANQMVVVQRVPNYTNVTVNSGINLTASAYDDLATTPTGTAGYHTGIVAFKATGTVTVTGNITVAGKGYLGGAAPGSTNPGNGGESFCGTGGGTGGIGGVGNSGSCGGGGGGQGKSSSNTGGSGSSTGGAGGGGGYCGTASTLRASGSGAGSGYGTAATGAGRVGAASSDGGTNTSGNGGTGSGDANTCLGGGGGGGGTYGNSSLTTLFHGSGGGSGSAYSTLNGGAGGNAGGIIYVTGSTISITGTVSANGSNGGDKNSLSSNYSGAGGGGSGGSLYILGTTVTLGTSLVTATGGTAGTGTANTLATDGGSGRIAVGATSVTGTTNPTYTAVSAP